MEKSDPHHRNVCALRGGRLMAINSAHTDCRLIKYFLNINTHQLFIFHSCHARTSIQDPVWRIGNSNVAQFRHTVSKKKWLKAAKRRCGKNILVWLHPNKACDLEGAGYKSKANCVLHHCTDLNLSATWGTPSRASGAHDWFNFYNSTRIDLDIIRIHCRGRMLILSPNIDYLSNCKQELVFSLRNLVFYNKSRMSLFSSCFLVYSFEMKVHPFNYTFCCSLS